MALSEEIKKLIEVAVEDGVLEDYEITVLREKAIQYGVNPDEVLMIARARCEQIIKEDRKITKQKQGRICPYCEKPITKDNILSGVCPHCHNAITIEDSGSKALLQYLNNLESSLVRLKENGALKFNPRVRAELESKIRQGRSFYGDNKKVNFLISEVEASIEAFEKKRRNIFISIISLIVAIVFSIGFGINSCSNNNKRMEQEIIAAANSQRDSLCTLIDNIPQPNSENYKDCERQLLSLSWKKIPDYNERVDREVYFIKQTYIEKKSAFAELIGAVMVEYMEDGKTEIGEYKHHGAPKPIEWTMLYIND